MSKNDDLVRRLRSHNKYFLPGSLADEAADAIERGATQGIAPLEWSISWGPDEEGDESHVAGTPFGSYTIDRSSGRWRWKYCFSEYYDEDEEDCDDLEDGKSRAWAHWLERVSPIISTPPAPAPDAGEEWKLVPREMTADMINAWSGGLTITTDTIARRTPFQEAWSRVLVAAPSPTPQPTQSNEVSVEAEAVTRFNPEEEETGLFYGMLPAANGDWVHYGDHKAALKKAESLIQAKTDEIERLKHRCANLEQASIRAGNAKYAAEASNKALREGLERAKRVFETYGWDDRENRKPAAHGELARVAACQIDALLSETGAIE